MRSPALKPSSTSVCSQFDSPLRQKSIAQVAADIRNGTLQVTQPATGNGKPARGK